VDFSSTAICAGTRRRKPRGADTIPRALLMRRGFLDSNLRRRRRRPAARFPVWACYNQVLRVDSKPSGDSAARQHTGGGDERVDTLRYKITEEGPRVRCQHMFNINMWTWKRLARGYIGFARSCSFA
jgi:hypothetical protein